MEIKENKIGSDKETIPLNKVSYEDLEALTIEQQTQLFVKDKEIERLNNIIKEVREYILTHKLYCFKYDDEELFEIATDKKAKDELLEILGSDKK